MAIAIIQRRTVLKLTPSSKLVMHANLPPEEDDEEVLCREDRLLRDDDL
jgi:hypothetical protein